jgi:hypothetical protein
MNIINDNDDDNDNNDKRHTTARKRPKAILPRVGYDPMTTSARGQHANPCAKLHFIVVLV